jgi:hypothetical protein
MKIAKSGSFSMNQDALPATHIEGKVPTDQPRCWVQCGLPFRKKKAHFETKCTYSKFVGFKFVYNKPETHVWQNATAKPSLLPEMYNTDFQNLFLLFLLYAIAST